MLTLLGCQWSYSQSEIEYKFSKDVEMALNERLNTYGDNQEWKFYLTIGRVLYQDDCGNFQLYVGTYKDKPLEVIESLISRSIHYYRTLEGKKIPIIFDYDYAFTSFGVDDKGRVIRKNVTGNDFVIEFDRNGKLIDW